MTCQSIIHNSYKLAYTSVPVPGRPTILFLPGYFSDMAGAKAIFLKEQAAGHQYGFLSLDYSGHGQSGGEFLQGTISSWLGDVFAVIDAVKAQDLIVVGSSMGGWLMLLLAIHRPYLVRKLVGIAAAPDFTEELIWTKLSPAKKQILQEQGQLITPSEYDAGGVPLSYQLIKDGRQNLVLKESINCKVPVRLLHGTADHDVPYETSLRIMQLLASSDVQVTLIKDGDHRLSQPEQLKVLWQEVQDC
ncbi:MAG: alpha/beta hydrolase [Candidatus Paracaedibacteraceae bacterium]|nr:alpha/beta hydrolase [Candidatus Paracaedibacteraceae bacterium]